MHSSRTHSDLTRIIVRLLLVLAVSIGGLLVAAGPASAGQCVQVYQGGVGTTVCTP